MDPGMHAPGYRYGHLLPAAGARPPTECQVFRHGRVAPCYRQDSCMRPNEADITCPPEYEIPSRPDLLPPAGCSKAPLGDTFQFYQVRGPFDSAGLRDCPHRKKQNCNKSKMFSSGHQMNQHCLPSNSCCPHPPPVTAQQCPETFPQHQPSCCGNAEPPMRTSDYPPFQPGSPGNYPVSRCGAGGNVANLQPPNPCCPKPYYPAPYSCRPVYNRWFLADCPEQDGPPADCYTFL